MANINQKNSPSFFEKKENKPLTTFPLHENGEFINKALFNLSNKKNNTTIDSARNFNEKLFDVLLGKYQNWGKYRVSCRYLKYCYCDGSYIFYSTETKNCKHNNKVIPSNQVMGLTNILEIMQMILSDKQNFDNIEKANINGREKFQNQQEIKETDEISTAMSALKVQLLAMDRLYKTADIVTTCFGWMDTFTLENGVTISVTLVRVVELGDRNGKEELIIPIAFWICKYPLHHSVYEPGVSRLRTLFLDRNIIRFFHYNANNSNSLQVIQYESTFKMLCIGLTNDKGLSNDIYNVKSSGYMSLPCCLQIGEYCVKAVHFPFYGTLYPLRTEYWASLCQQAGSSLRKSEYGGQKGISSWSKYNLFDLYSSFETERSDA